MMPLVIDQDEAAFRQRQFAGRLATTTDTAKAGQRTTHRIERHTELASDRARRQRVLDIVLAWQIEMKGFPARFGFAVVEADREMPAAAFGANVAGMQSGIVRQTEGDARRRLEGRRVGKESCSTGGYRWERNQKK